MKLPFEPEFEDQNEPWDVINQRENLIHVGDSDIGDKIFKLVTFWGCSPDMLKHIG